MMRTFSRSFACLFLFAFSISLKAQQKSFPGAEGAGSFTSGGRGTVQSPTTVFEVTNLTDVNTPGSLRYACAQSVNNHPYRTIVFRVAGTIHLNSKLNIPANTTIAGQTAPGDGICIADYPVVISGNNVIIRYLRIRMGDKNQLKTTPVGCGVPVPPFSAACRPIDGSGGDDALGALGPKNIIIDHCSVSWSSDEALTIYRGDSLTLQWNIISEPLNYNYHYESPDNDFQQHGYGGIWGALNASFHHNLFAHCRNRTPRFGGNNTYAPGAIESADFRNNVLYNWGINNVYGGEGGQYNVVNNYYKFGPNTSTGVRYRIVTVDSNDAYGWAKYYLSGNYVDGSAVNTANNWTGASLKSGKAQDSVKSKVNTPFLPAFLPAVAETALDAYDTVLKGVGCSIPVRDTLDQRIMNDVKNRTGRIIDVQGGFPHGTPYAQTVDAWPYLAAGMAPVDTDHDGMPDEWETANSLNPNDASDRGIFAPNGYTNLENYLNSIQGKTLSDPDPPAGTTATATWPLLADQEATVTGQITATSQQLGAYLSGIQYGSSFGTIPGWQRVGTTSYLPVGYTADSYVEYKLTPADGQVFTATSIELGALGGGTGTAKLAVYYSLDNFATSFAAGTCTYNGQTYAATQANPVDLLNTSTTPLSGQQVATIPTAIKVDPGQTLSVRMFVWIAGSGNRYFPSQLVKITGVTSSPALPLRLTSFSAGLQNDQTQLFWQTTNEVDVVRFEVERSTDGRTFSRLGAVSAGNSASNRYNFNDPSVPAGVVYYRLKIINRDATISYSNIISVNSRLKERLSVFPNPVERAITITHKTANRKATVSIFNMEGKRLMQWRLTPGTTQASLTVEKLAAGNYLVQYNDGETFQAIKFIKQ